MADASSHAEPCFLHGLRPVGGASVEQSGAQQAATTGKDASRGSGSNKPHPPLTIADCKEGVDGSSPSERFVSWLLSRRFCCRY